MLTDFLNNVSFFTWRNILFNCATIFLNLTITGQDSQLLRQPSITITSDKETTIFLSSNDHKDKQPKDIFLPYCIKVLDLSQARKGLFVGFESLDAKNKIAYLITDDDCNTQKFTINDISFEQALTKTNWTPKNSNQKFYNASTNEQFYTMNRNQNPAGRNHIFKCANKDAVENYSPNSIRLFSLSALTTTNTYSDSTFLITFHSTEYCIGRRFYRDYYCSISDGMEFFSDNGESFFTLKENDEITYMDGLIKKTTPLEIVQLFQGQDTSTEAPKPPAPQPNRFYFINKRYIIGGCAFLMLLLALKRFIQG